MEPWHYTARVHDENRIGVRMPGCESVISRADALKLYASLGEALAQQIQPPAVEAASVPARPAKSVGKLTERMAYALDDMTKGGVVESDTGFSWPSWKTWPKTTSSHGCPPCAVLEGLHARGLLEVKQEPSSAFGRGKWFATINDHGREALAQYREAKRSPKPNPFKRFQMSFVRVSVTGKRSVHRAQETVVARNENEARRKLEAIRGESALLDDVRIEGVFG